MFWQIKQGIIHCAGGSYLCENGSLYSQYRYAGDFEEEGHICVRMSVCAFPVCTEAEICHRLVSIIKKR